MIFTDIQTKPSTCIIIAAFASNILYFINSIFCCQWHTTRYF